MKSMWWKLFKTQASTIEAAIVEACHSGEWGCC
jgi:hypothetical protein